MAIDMKKTIAEAASSLLFEKRVKKLTVKRYCGRMSHYQTGILLSF